MDDRLSRWADKVEYRLKELKKKRQQGDQSEQQKHEWHWEREELITSLRYIAAAHNLMTKVILEIKYHHNSRFPVLRSMRWLLPEPIEGIDWKIYQRTDTGLALRNDDEDQYGERHGLTKRAQKMLERYGKWRGS